MISIIWKQSASCLQGSNLAQRVKNILSTETRK